MLTESGRICALQSDDLHLWALNPRITLSWLPKEEIYLRNSFGMIIFPAATLCPSAIVPALNQSLAVPPSVCTIFRSEG